MGSMISCIHYKCYKSCHRCLHYYKKNREYDNIWTETSYSDFYGDMGSNEL